MFLGVPVRLSGMNEQERAEWALKIARARTRAGLSKEAAAKKAGVTATTWRRAEAAERLHDAKFAAILNAVGLSMTAPGASLLPELPLEALTAQPSLFLLPEDLENGYNQTVAFTRAVSEHVPELARDATRLMLAASELFARAGSMLVEGGDRNGDTAPTNQGGEDDLTVDLAAYPSDED